MQFARTASGFTLTEIMVVVVVIFTFAIIGVPASTAFRSKVAVSSACETAKIIQSAMADYALSKNDSYPTTHEAHKWAAFRDICASHGATLAETREQQGLCFFQYHGLDAEGRNCDSAVPETVCPRYYIVMRVHNVHGDQIGAQLEINEDGILRQTY